MEKCGRLRPMQLSSPAAGRNLAPITSVLDVRLPAAGTVLEIASGPGQHALAFAKRYANLVWQPTDVGASALSSINAWADDASVANLLPAFHLDAASPDWPSLVPFEASAMLAVNLCHIAPWQVTVGLLAGAGKVLSPGGPLFIYGPFKVEGQHTAPSNAAFDDSLRSANPSHGVRDLGDLVAAAEAVGLELSRRHDMPSNNFIAEFRRTSCDRR
jgi:SAM-dependent methyltransferase